MNKPDLRGNGLECGIAHRQSSLFSPSCPKVGFRTFPICILHVAQSHRRRCLLSVDRGLIMLFKHIQHYKLVQQKTFEIIAVPVLWLSQLVRAPGSWIFLHSFLSFCANCHQICQLKQQNRNYRNYRATGIDPKAQNIWAMRQHM